jgi:hypothetical protein
MAYYDLLNVEGWKNLFKIRIWRGNDGGSVWTEPNGLTTRTPPHRTQNQRLIFIQHSPTAFVNHTFLCPCPAQTPTIALFSLPRAFVPKFSMYFHKIGSSEFVSVYWMLDALGQRCRKRGNDKIHR